MNSSLSAKDLFRSLCIALILMLALAVVARSQEVAAPAPAVAPDDAQPKETTPVPTPAPVTVAPTPVEKTGLRRLDNLPPANEPAVPDPASSRRRRVRRDTSGSERVAFGHGATLDKGEFADAVVSIFGSSNNDGSVSDAVVSVLGDTRTTGPVGDSVVAVLGDVYVNSKVDGEVVAVLGDVELGPEAEIGRDVVVVGGRLKRDPAAIIHGRVQNVGIDFGHFGADGGLRSWFRECFLKGRPLAIAPHLEWAWFIAFSFLALYALMALIFRSGVERCVQTLEDRPGGSILAAFLAMLLAPIVITLLGITVIGFVVIPFLGLGLFLAGLFGKAVMLTWLGRRLSRNLPPAAAVLIGGVIVMALYTLWGIGFLTYMIIKVIGLGVVIYTVVISMRREKPLLAVGPSKPMATVPLAAPVSIPPVSTPPSAGFVSTPVVPMAATDSTITGDQAASFNDLRVPVEPAAGVQPPLQPPVIPVTPPPIIPNATLPRAGFWIRTAALLIDLVLVGIVFGPLSHSGSFVLLSLAAYGAVMWKLKCTTVGGIICGLKVVRLDDRPLDWPTTVVRALGCFLSLAVAGLGFIWVIFDDQHQSWHDKIAGTVVVKVPRGASLV